VNPDYTLLQRKTFQEQEKLIKIEAGNGNDDLKNGPGRELLDAGWRWDLRGRWGQRHLTKVKSTSALSKAKRNLYCIKIVSNDNHLYSCYIPITKLKNCNFPGIENLLDGVGLD
jgi:hypothetical protein